MLKTYGDAFNKYRAAVPRLFPRFKPFTGGDIRRPNWRDGLAGELPQIFIFATLTPLIAHGSRAVGLALLGLFIAGRNPRLHHSAASMLVLEFGEFVVAILGARRPVQINVARTTEKHTHFLATNGISCFQAC